MFSSYFACNFSDMEIESLLASAKQQLSEHKFEQAITFSDLAFCQVTGQQLVEAITVSGISKFFLSQFKQAADLFLALPVLTSDDILPGIISNDKFSVLIGLSVMVTAERQAVLLQLTSSVNSVCRNFFDSETFEPLTRIGKEWADCQYTRVMAVVRSAMWDFVPEEIVAGIVKVVEQKLVAELVTSFDRIKFADIGAEFGLEESFVVGLVEELVESGTLGEYRINMRDSCVVRIEKRINMVEKEMIETLNELKLFNLRMCILESKLNVSPQ